ncbi:MAG: hypothetical protein JW915_13565 [Chitinispirillaceae bacterium]|nr:hypothetical protein [Chitinispirillaceae bacterium]
MNLKIACYGVLMAVLWCLNLQAKDSPVLSGYLRNYTAVLANDDPEFAMLQNTANLSLDYRIDKTAFRLSSWITHYPSKELELGLREAYLDLYLGAFDIRIGKQQVIWGKGEGVFITDIVSPKDMREFLLPDFDEIRTGINALKTTYYRGNHNIEVVLVPQFIPTIMPEKGSIWRVEPEFPVPPLIDSSRVAIPFAVKNSEVFAKYSLMSPIADIDIMGGYLWDDDPAMHVRRTIDLQTRQPASITVTPRHHRLSVVGAAFSMPLGDFVIRGDGAWYAGKRYATVDPRVTDGLVEKQYVNYLLGGDYTVWETRLSAQFIQRIILDHCSLMAEDKVDNMATLLINRKFLRETLTLELFSYIGLNERDALVRPRIMYDFADGFQLQLGANIFAGDEGRFGQFDNNDMAYLKIKFSF